MPMPPTVVLVTVPHATGQGLSVRTNDRAALRAADALVQALAAHRDIAVRLLVGDEARRACDLNRAERCDSPARFKQTYREALARRPALVVDMHSFPASHTWGARTAPAVALLYDADYRSLAERAARALAQRGVAVAVVPGAIDVNYIITEASEARVPNVLVELNESLADVTTIIDALAAFVATEVGGSRYVWPPYFTTT